jgi:hypothetical protein
MRAAGADPVDGEAEDLRRLLTVDDVTADERIDAESRPKREGVDPEAVTDEFVAVSCPDASRRLSRHRD